MLLEQKTALVTGGSRGIGRAISVEFAKNGADVAFFYAGNEDAARAAESEITALGRRCLALRCDVSDEAAVKEASAKVLEAFGKLDILVNNAGVVRDGLVLSMKEADYDAVLDTNLKGAFHLIRQFYSPMMKKRSGRILNITSVSGLAGNAGQANYAAAKAGLIGLTKSVAKELAARGITCNAVAPGFIETDMTAALPEKTREAAVGAIPMKRMGAPEEVAALCVFLASDAASYITGEVIRVDGGLCM